MCERLLAEGYRVVRMNNLITGDRENVAHLMGSPGFEFVEHDVTTRIDVPGPVDEVFPPTLTRTVFLTSTFLMAW